jgi:serine/threonine protein phosphatase PrpC
MEEGVQLTSFAKVAKEGDCSSNLMPVAVQEGGSLESPEGSRADGGPHTPISSVFASHALLLKGEDGLRVERLMIGGEIVLCAVVMDGHGGHQAALLAVDNIIECICEESHDNASSISLSQALRRAFARLHGLLLEDQRHTAGTTATVCLINETRAEVTTAHVGDSAAILVPAILAAGVNEHAATPLTGDHRLADSEAERARVVAAGGKIGQAIHKGKACGPLRAFPGGVCCARALGDRDCGQFISPMPDITVMPIPQAGALVLIATDGLWDVVPQRAVVKVALNSNDVHDAAERLVAKALRTGGLRDDISCVCIVGGRVDSSARANTQPRSPAMRLMSQLVPSAFRMWENRGSSSSSSPKQASPEQSPEPTAKGGVLFASLAASQALPPPVQVLDESPGSLAAAATDEGLAQQMSRAEVKERRLPVGCHSASSDEASDNGAGALGARRDERSPGLFISLQQQPTMQLRPWSPDESRSPQDQIGVPLLVSTDSGVVKLKPQGEVVSSSLRR